MTAKPAADLVFVAAIAAAHGVRGECKVKSFTGDPEAAFSYGPFLDAAGKEILRAKRWRPVKDGWVVAFEQELSREDAQALRGTQLFVPRSALPELDDEEYYHSDLIGLTVQGLDGSPMGKLKAVHDFGSGDLLEITGTPGRNGDWYLPFTRDFVPHISLKDGLITIDPPEDVGSKEEEAGGEASISQ
tara:strand:- start:328 stop:891 length:564 start_codon:yes stop_codon:yes gene_type:complete